MSLPPGIIHMQRESPDFWYEFLHLKELEQANGLADGILKHLINVESHGDPKAKSQCGARGLFQIMPKNISGFDGNPLNYIAAAQYAAETLKKLHDHFGNYEDAVAAYNWGRGHVNRDPSLHTAPEETKKYVQAFKNAGIVKDIRMLKEIP